MKSLQIQLQPGLAPGLDVMSEAVRLQRVVEAAGIAGPVRVTEGEDNGPYINIDITADDVTAVWSRLRQEWRPGGPLVGCSIVCCEGDAGWDDYKLLHHFDASESLDELA